MAKFTIYHLIGRKYGCSAHYAKRIKRYPRHTVKLLLKVVAELADAQEAEALEQQLNLAAGYKRQLVPYRHTVRISPLGAALGGQKVAELGHGIHQQTSAEKAALGRLGGLKGGLTVRDKKLGIFGLTPEQKAANIRKALARAAETRDPAKLAEHGRRLGAMRGQCEHCGVTTNAGNLAQFHGERCRSKPAGPDIIVPPEPKVMIRRPV